MGGRHPSNLCSYRSKGAAMMQAPPADTKLAERATAEHPEGVPGGGR
jgi:hypothetical protein